MGRASGEAGEADGSKRPMRADAVKNRERILEAAAEVFAATGISVPIDVVAERAGVGVGTLYRHFPTKEALFEAVIVQHMERVRDEARALTDSDEPGEALFLFLGFLAREVAAKRNLFEALSGAGINVKATAGEIKEELEAAAALLLARAQQAGQVRPDVTVPDVVGLVLGACSAASGDVSDCSSARMMAIVCDGLRGERASDGAPAD
jgi:AcrR family transcriptional regulator